MWKVFWEAEDFIIYESKKKCPNNFPICPFEGWEEYGSGGQFPHFIFYDPAKIKIVELSSNERLHFESGILYVDPSEALLLTLPASVHGCWKAKRRQLALVLRKDAELLYK